MKLCSKLCIVAFCLAVRTGLGEEIAIDPTRFQLEIDRQAEARSTLADNEGRPGKEIVVTVSKPGPEFWDVEVRAPGFSFEQGKRYDLVFRAKGSQSEFVYFVLEKSDGTQESIARGTFLQIPGQWVDCTVEFEVQQNAPTARITISNLSVHQATFTFSDFRLVAK
ncbi:MAG: carbohydrate binding domain-containing protein [Verrucomicrobia bacterium]|nr:carbohydrate binding domain-containing protein [Verrucomicrobiota bacterium]